MVGGALVLGSDSSPLKSEPLTVITGRLWDIFLSFEQYEDHLGKVVDRLKFPLRDVTLLEDPGEVEEEADDPGSCRHPPGRGVHVQYLQSTWTISTPQS